MKREDWTNYWMCRARKRDEPSKLPGAALEVVGVGLLIEINDTIRRRNVLGEKDNQLLLGLFKTAAGMFW